MTADNVRCVNPSTAFLRSLQSQVKIQSPSKQENEIKNDDHLTTTAFVSSGKEQKQRVNQ